MPIHVTRLARARLIAAIAIVLATFAFAVAASAQQSQPPALVSLDQARVALDRIEATLKGNLLSTDVLVDLSRSATPIRDSLRDKIANIEPRFSRAEARLKQLGPPPAKGVPPEPADLAAERKQVNDDVAALDSELKQARLLAVRADQLAQTITERRYAAYARELFKRSWSALDPDFWVQAATALVTDIRRVTNLVLTWWGIVSSESSALRIGGAGATLVVIAIAALFGRRRWRDWGMTVHPASRLGKATHSLWALIRTAAFEPILVLVIVQVLELYGLLPWQFQDVAYGLVTAVALGAFGRGVATGVFAPYQPQRRLVAASDQTARALSRHLVIASRLVTVFVFLEAVQKAVYSPPILIGLAGILFALSIVAVMLHLLFTLRAETEGEVQHTADRSWARAIAWLMTGAIVIAVLAGYARLAGFLAERLLASIIIAGAFYVLLMVNDALFTDGIAVETKRGRAIAANLGLPPRRVALIGALLSGAVRLLLLLLAIILILGPWEGTTTDLIGAARGFSFVFTIGEATISFKAVLIALAVLLIGMLLTRWARRWLETKILPRTDLEPSLRLSVGVIFGYLGVIAAISFSLGALGIDLQKIALVAGALSVGIGFGLQSIVSNFVSGLILLTERPIRVGDWIVAKGEEGFVRRIRVRATEIETFDRASVIIPNSDLISGVVKNWTHGNILGRITIKVGVSYDSDVEQVKRLLLAVADEHPLVLKEPAPYVIFMAFGDSSLDFELRCIVRDIQQSLTARSDLNFAVLARFRAAGIEIPFPQRVLHVARGAAGPSDLVGPSAGGVEASVACPAGMSPE